MKTKRIHLISIGGAVMHNLALCLHEMGYSISGSDDEIFEPSKSRLNAAGLLPDKQGWNPDNITHELDAVILGMHAKQDNPELIRALELNIKVYSFPEFIYEQSINKKRVVIAGSHGKTTTTAMLMHALKSAGIDFDYLVGSQLAGFTTMVRLSNAPIIVIEGDEYLNSALDPRPKFLFYHAHMAQITGIAWDHVNVFPTWEMYVEQFRLFINQLPDGGLATWFGNDDTVKQLMAEQGTRLNSHAYSVLPHRISEGNTIVEWNGVDYPMLIFGSHNLENMAGAMVLAEELGISNSVFLSQMTTFAGTARRLERVKSTGNLLVYRDFAHSPSKLMATVDSVKSQFPTKRLLAVFELHTFSSMQQSFLPEYLGSLEAADERIVFFSPRVLEHKKLPALNPESVANFFGDNVQVFTDAEKLHAHLSQTVRGNDVLLLMSSGTFEGMSLDFKA